MTQRWACDERVATQPGIETYLVVSCSLQTQGETKIYNGIYGFPYNREKLTEVLRTKWSWNRQEGYRLSLGASSDRALMTMMNWPLPCYTRDTVARENLSADRLYPTLFRRNIGFMIGRERDGLEFSLLIQPPERCSRIAHMSYVQRSPL